VSQPLNAGVDTLAGQLGVQGVLDRRGDALPQLPGHDHTLRAAMGSEHHRRRVRAVVVEPGRDLVQPRAASFVGSTSVTPQTVLE